MAQLIKLRDYISRYETNPFHYPTQFIRLKQENWRKLVKAWQEENEAELEAERWQVAMQEGASRSFRWNPFRKRKKNVQKMPFCLNDIYQVRKISYGSIF